MAVRREEQILAARIGGYSFIAQLDYPSSAVKSATDRSLTGDLTTLLAAAQPEVVYTHNPADKHDTHLGVVAAVLDAIRSLPAGQRPRQVLGCEVWRDLDWMIDADKSVLDVSGHENLAAALNGVFDSQIAGGKRYDLAVMGRRRANATFYDSHSTDTIDQAWLALDLTPLIRDEQVDLIDFTLSHIDRFRADVEQKLNKRLGR
jgi:LmbE family N-acetylglucosaminyl deacetylase